MTTPPHFQFSLHKLPLAGAAPGYPRVSPPGLLLPHQQRGQPNVPHATGAHDTGLERRRKSAPEFWEAGMADKS